jgi:murein DD-endopeptidase MepM/ murein hydrolase activator NlpD
MSKIILSRKFKAMACSTAALLILAGCETSQSPDKAAVEIKGSSPATTASAAPAPAVAPLSSAPDASGVVVYDGYEAAVARSGDTVASVADRVGLSASELGAYNGLAPNHSLRLGDELVLPPRPGGYSSQPVPAAPAASTDMVVATAPVEGAAIESAPIESAPLWSSSDGTAPPAAEAPAAGQPADQSAGWSPDIAAAAIARAEGFNEQGELGVPPSSSEPLPPDPKKPGQLASPQFSQYQTPVVKPGAPQPPARPVETITTPAEQPVEELAKVEPVEEVTKVEPVEEPAKVEPVQEPAKVEPVQEVAKAEPAAPAPAASSELRLIRPVTGPVVIGFNQGAGRSRNDGIDFASPAGSPVVAAAGGEVALVSQSLGGLGTIVLVRHAGDYLTVYGRIERVTVAKGDIVNQGQKIGVVSPSPEPRMHFEVRHGAESVDPERFF